MKVEVAGQKEVLLVHSQKGICLTHGLGKCPSSKAILAIGIPSCYAIASTICHRGAMGRQEPNQQWMFVLPTNSHHFCLTWGRGLGEVHKCCECTQMYPCQFLVMGACQGKALHQLEVMLLHGGLIYLHHFWCRAQCHPEWPIPVQFGQGFYSEVELRVLFEATWIVNHEPNQALPVCAHP